MAKLTKFSLSYAQQMDCVEILPVKTKLPLQTFGVETRQ